MFNDKWNKKTVSEIFSELKEDQSGAFHVISDLLQSVVQLFDDAISVFTSGSNPEDVEAAVRGRLDQTNRLAQRLIVQSRRQIEMSAGLVFLGIASNLAILGQALGSLSAFSLSDFDRKILKNSWSDLLGRYEAIWKHDPVSHRKRERPHSSFSTIYRRGRGRNIDFGKNLERMTEASRRFSRIADMTLAA